MEQKKYLVIKNAGSMEPEAFTLLGASTKRNDDRKIGQFGSGNKYALAYLLRNHYSVKIFAGSDEIKITTTPLVFRELGFDVIMVNDKSTSITTDMGKDWKLWQALRELYSNALDEGGAKFQLVDTIAPDPEETHIYIETDESIMEFVKEFDKYFAENRIVLFENYIGKILQKIPGNTNVYRKGIRCLDWDRRSLYDYDLNNITIDEDRMVSYHWQVEENIWKLLFQCTNKEVIKNVLINGSKDTYLETNLSEYSSISANKLSEEFKQVIADSQMAPSGLSGLLSTEERQKTLIVPSKIFNVLRPIVQEETVNEKFRMGAKNIFYIEIEPNKLEAATLKRAQKFFDECGLSIPYDVRLARFDNKKFHGTISGELIIVSDICVGMGLNWVINTIIEEHIHIKYGVKDESRAFQDAIIGEFINYMKKEKGFVL